jgi:hypothetical protein
VAYQYGGGDPNVVYVRDRIVPLRDGFESYCKVDMGGIFPLYSLRDLVKFEDRETKEVAYLVVAGKAYLLMKTTNIGDNDVNTFKIQPIDFFEEFYKQHSMRWFARHEKGECGKEYPFLVELSRKIGAPVFVILNAGRKWNSDKIEVEISGQCPILKEIGMPALVSAPQMYQELAYFVGNTMKEHPDTEPPVEVSNTSKILNAGFDLKQSFRHRI